MNNKDIIDFLNVYNVFAESKGKVDVRYVTELGIKAFHAALTQEDTLRRFDLVSQIVRCLKFLAQDDTAAADFLLARKKMINYSVLEQLTDPNRVTFTLNDCEVLSQRYRVMQEEAE